MLQHVMHVSVGEGYLLSDMSEEPRNPTQLCSRYWEGLHIFLRGAIQCSAIMLRKLLFCNFTPGDKQIKIYYLGWWSAAGQEIGSFSPNNRIISATYLSESILWWQRDMDDCSSWFELGQRIMEMEDRQLIWLCATVNVWGGERIIVHRIR